MDLCRHFGTCGGCSLQNLAESDYRALKRRHVEQALARHGLDFHVEELVSVPPRSRRRAVLKAAKKDKQTLVGFHAASSHAIVDMHECHVLTPALTALAGALRSMMGAILQEGEDADLHVTETDTGFDVLLKWKKPVAPALTAEIARWAGKLGIARVVSGRELLVSLAQPSIRIGKATMRLPPAAFLQPTVEGERVLQAHVMRAAKGARKIFDLFAGCGTFSLVLAAQARVHAVEIEDQMLSALSDAARNCPGLKPVTTERRDLFRRPLVHAEVAGVDLVVLDPPRAGARAQAEQLATSGMPRIVYVSCEAETFARDAAILVAGGYVCEGVLPLDQFLWSDHIELAATFEKASRGTKR